jgi:hypothetical protein
MCGAVWIHVYEFPQTVRRVVRSDQAPFEVFQRFPFRVKGVGVTDVEVYARGRAEAIVLGPLGEVDRHCSAVGKTIQLRPFVAAGVESDSAVSVQGGVKVSNGDDRGHRGEINCGHTTVCQPVGVGVLKWAPAVYLLAVDSRADQGVHSGGRAGQATILAPSPNLAVTPNPMAS